MPLFVRGRRAGAATRGAWERELLARHGHVVSLDLTSRGVEPWVRFSPFFPHGGIPVPYSPGESSQTVEGIWQALKVFEHEGVDRAKLAITTMRRIRRSAGKRRGRVLGHREGLRGERLLDYAEARRAIYLPSYHWALEHRLQDLVGRLHELAAAGAVILLDFETNTDVDDLTTPLSHAGLVAAYVEGRWPS
jgi:hypothetical protein